jgi:hypothetical protein
LQPTELVDAAYVRLMGQRQVDWRNRAHFLEQDTVINIIVLAKVLGLSAATVKREWIVTRLWPCRELV